MGRTSVIILRAHRLSHKAAAQTLLEGGIGLLCHRGYTLLARNNKHPSLLFRFDQRGIQILNPGKMHVPPPGIKQGLSNPFH